MRGASVPVGREVWLAMVGRLWSLCTGEGDIQANIGERNYPTFSRKGLLRDRGIEVQKPCPSVGHRMNASRVAEA